MFGVNTKSTATICRGCLSTDRKLSPLTNNKLYFNLLNDNQKQEDECMESKILVCWECTAALKRMQSFQEQAQKAHMVLEKTLYNPASITSLSTLTTYHKHSYDAIIHELEVEVKVAEQLNSIVPVTIPIKQEVISVDISEETNEEDCNDIEDSDNNELYSKLSLEENTVADELKPITVIKTKIKVEDFCKTRKSTRQTIVKRPSLPRSKKRSLDNIVVNRKDLISSKNVIKKSSASPLQPSQGLRRSKRKSGTVEVKKRKNSNDYNVQISDYLETNNSELTKEENASDSDIGDREDVDLSIFNKDGFKNEEVKANKIDFLETDQANDSGNCERDNAHTDSKDNKSKESVSGKVLEQSKENEVDESNEVNLDAFRKTTVAYSDSDELDTYFTKLELSEEETKAALEGEPKYANKELPFMCNYCGLCFQIKKTMLNHVKKCHVKLIKKLKDADPNVYYRNSMYRCKNCPAVLRKAQTVAHMKYVHRIKYYCKHCDMGFWNNKDCKSHLITNHSSFDCDLCSETRPTWKLLEQHIKRKHKVRKQYKIPVQCEECGKKVSSSYSLISHQEVRHPREGTDPRFHCEPCKVTLRSEKHYRWHMKYHKAHKVKPSCVACPTCGKECSSNFVLKQHHDRFHTDKTNFQCKICGKYLASKCALNSHVDGVHLNITLPKDKFCTICGRGFSQNRILTHHMRTHTGERPFACAFCPAAFAQRTALKQHTATQHTRTQLKTKRNKTELNLDKTTEQREHEAQSQSRGDIWMESQSLDEIGELRSQDEDVAMEESNMNT